MPLEDRVKPEPTPEELKYTRLNRVYLRGWVGRDAEISLTTTGKHRAHFTINTGSGTKKAGGEYPPEWHHIVCWGDRAACCDVVKKGKNVLIEGRLQYFEGRDNRLFPQVAAHRIEIEGLDIMDPKAHYLRPAPVAAPLPEAPLEITDDDIPF